MLNDIKVASISVSPSLFSYFLKGLHCIVNVRVSIVSLSLYYKWLELILNANYSFWSTHFFQFAIDNADKQCLLNYAANILLMLLTVFIVNIQNILSQNVCQCTLSLITTILKRGKRNATPHNARSVWEMIQLTEKQPLMFMKSVSCHPFPQHYLKTWGYMETILHKCTSRCPGQDIFGLCLSGHKHGKYSG